MLNFTDLRERFQFVFILTKDTQVVGYEVWDGAHWLYSAPGAQHLDIFFWSLFPIIHDTKFNAFTAKEHNARVV